MTLIKKSSLLFLKQLSENNNREWFNKNKTLYKAHENDLNIFFHDIFQKLSITDNIEAYKMKRIYRDIRFSKDKTPYNPRFAASFKRFSESLRGSYFINITTDKCIVGGGFYGPNKTDLHRIRKEFEIDSTEINNILNDKIFKKVFPSGLLGDSLKTSPRGFNKAHNSIKLIRKKQFYVMKTFSAEEVASDVFQKKVLDVFVTLRPFFNYMSEVLTTNLNGESILKD